MSEVKRKIARTKVLDEEDLLDLEVDYEEGLVDDEEQKYFYSDEDDNELNILNDYEEIEISNEEDLSEENSKDFLKQVLNFLSSKGFEKGYTKYSEIHNRKKEEIRDSLCKKILRRIGEALDITICITYDFFGFLVKLITKILNQAIDVAYKVACSIICFFTKKAIC